MNIAEQFKHIQALLADVVYNNAHVTISMAADDIQLRILENQESYYITRLTPLDTLNPLFVEIALEPYRMTLADKMLENNVPVDAAFACVSDTAEILSTYYAMYANHELANEEPIERELAKPHKTYSELMESDFEIIGYLKKTKGYSIRTTLTIYNTMLPFLERLNFYRSKFRVSQADAIEAILSTMAETSHYEDSLELPKFQATQARDDNQPNPFERRLVREEVKKEDVSLIFSTIARKNAEEKSQLEEPNIPHHIRGKGQQRSLLAINGGIHTPTGRNHSLETSRMQNLLGTSTISNFPVQMTSLVLVCGAFASALYCCASRFFKPAAAKEQTVAAKETKTLRM